MSSGDTTDIIDAIDGLYYPDKEVGSETTPAEKFMEVVGHCLYVAPAVATVDAFSGKSKCTTRV